MIKVGLLKIPNNQEMYFLKGIVYFNLHEIKTASKYFEKSLKVNKPQVKTYLYLSLIYFLTKNHEKIEYYFNLAINLDGEFINAEENILDKLIDKYQIMTIK